MRGRAQLLTAITALALLTATIPAITGGSDGEDPIVLIHGWTGDSDSWREMLPKLEAQRLPVLDFDPNQSGTQALDYEPTGDGQHISYLAGKIVEDKITQALVDNGYSADHPVDVVAHSMGGLVARFLIEQPGADVEHWDGEDGWYGDGTADVRTDWAERVDELIMLGTPNHGTWEAWVPANIGGFGEWNPSGGDMQPGSVFLDRMGYSEPSGEHYHGVGGDPAYLQFLSYDYDGDGVSHGFDGVVPAESPYLDGASLDLLDDNHFELRTSDQAVDLTIQLLGESSTVDGVGDATLAGNLTVRLEQFEVASDHDGGGSDEYVFDVHVDPDGSVGDAGYEHVGTIEAAADGPTTISWGDDGPTAGDLGLPGTSPVTSVKVVVKEDDTSWGGGYESVSTHYLEDLMLSEDIDGQDYYAGDAADSDSGTNTVQLSLNGITADIEHTRRVELGFDASKIKDDHDWGEGEVTFELNGGRLGLTAETWRGMPGESHYGRDSGEWVDIGTHARDDGVVEDEQTWSGRMLWNATLRFDVTYWEDDGGWSSVDGGNLYYLEAPLTDVPEGHTDYVGDSLYDYDAYLWVEKTDDTATSTAADEPRELESEVRPLSFVPDPPEPGDLTRR